MTVTLQAHDMVIAALALLGVVMLAAGALALLVKVLGRKLPDILEGAAAWALTRAPPRCGDQAESLRSPCCPTGVC
jgi:hypothetical protein